MSKFLNDLGNFAVILGSQWGDEGKGKLIDILSDKFDVVARAAGGANAGHTIYLGKDKFIFHLIPSGMLRENCICVIGNGVVLHLQTMFEELDVLEKHGFKTKGRILVSDRAHLVFDYHKAVDAAQEESKGGGKVGTTLRGIGPAYTDKIRRAGIRVHEICDFKTFERRYRENLKYWENVYGKLEGKMGFYGEKELAELKKLSERLKPIITDTSFYLNDALDNGKKILVEGANGALLDIDHGTYPYVTSSNTTIGGIGTGTGLSPTKATSVIGIMKAYTTRVGGGPFPSELDEEMGNRVREAGGEYGSTTGRPRRCGWFDAVVGRYAVMINGLTDINLTKLDVLTGIPILKIATAYKYQGQKLNSFPATLEAFEKIEVEYLDLPGWKENISLVRNYKNLPENARKYVEKIEKLVGCRVTSIGVGAERGEMVFK